MFRSPDTLPPSGVVSILTLALLALIACDENKPAGMEADLAGAVDISLTVPAPETAPVASDVLVISSDRYGIGEAADPAVVAGWDIDVRPDGLGLPLGEGSVEDGEEIYDEKCASCHGTFGEGEKRWPKLSGGMNTLTLERPDKTVGSYWPYASTLWDYIHRAMPFTAPQSLTVDETYAVTAYVLNLNDLVEDDFVLDQENLASIEMPNKDGFYVDDRPDTHNPRCMQNCTDPEARVIAEVISGITPTDHFKEDGNLGLAFAETPAAQPESKALSEIAQQGQTIYGSACQVCHDSGVGGAPVLGAVEQWAPRISQGKEKLYKNALQGFQGDSGLMPAKGGRSDLSDEDVKAAVEFMLESSQ